MCQYTIAGHTVSISGEGLTDSLPGFGFFAEAAGESGGLLLDVRGLRVKPVVAGNIEGLQVDTATVSGLSPVFSSEYEDTVYDLFVKNESYLFRMRKLDGSSLLAEISRRDVCFQSEIRWTGSFNNDSFRYICWLLFGIAALSRQTVSVHSSAVICGGKSVFFLGESGTGKSTHTRSWLKHIPGTELLNDDSPFVKVETDGSIRAYGSPWSGKTPCYRNIHTPVAAFVRLSQAPFNRIRRLAGIEAIGALLPSCPFAFAYDKQLSGSIYSILSLILQQLPVYHLECLPDADAARLVYSTLKDNNHL